MKVAKLDKLKWSREPQEVGRGIRVLSAHGPSNHAWLDVEVPFVSAAKKPFAKLLKQYPSYLERREASKNKPFETVSVMPHDISMLERISGKQVDTQWLIECVRFPLEAAPKIAIFRVMNEPKIARNGRKSSIRRLPTRESILEWAEHSAPREAESGIIQIVSRLTEEMPVLAAATDKACDVLVYGAIEQELLSIRRAAKVVERSKDSIRNIINKARKQIEALLAEADKELNLNGLGSTPLTGGLDHINYHRRPRDADTAEIDARVPKLVERLKQELKNIESGVSPVPTPFISVSVVTLGNHTNS